MKYLRLFVITLAAFAFAPPAFAASAQDQLFKAVMMGDAVAVERALADGADVNAKNKHGLTPVLSAAHMGHKDIVRYLVSKGADIEAKDKRGRSAMTHAAHKGNTELMKVLRAAGAKE